jgi:Pyruvate/2-oxoacid:ferredoxin oxidoreductase delta subunit
MIADFKKPDTHNKMSMFNKIPQFIKRPLQRAFTQIPVINSPKCIGCAECFKACPAKTIKIKNKKAVIYYADCIKCFCCQELCPEKAIDIKRKGLFRR